MRREGRMGTHCEFEDLLLCAERSAHDDRRVTVCLVVLIDRAHRDNTFESEEQKNRRTEEQKNRRTEEQKNKRTKEQKNKRSEDVFLFLFLFVGSLTRIVRGWLGLDLVALLVKVCDASCKRRDQSHVFLHTL